MLFLSDLDGTLMDSNGNGTDEDVECIHQRTQKHAFGFVTGRDRAFCVALASKYQLSCEYMNTDNGANAYYKDKNVYSSLIDLSEGIRMCKAILAYNLYLFYTDEAGNPYANPNVKRVEEYAAKEGAQVVAVSAKIEAEIAELPDDEAEVFLEELGLPESGLDKLIKASYSLLGLINFFTAGSDEVRAWTIVNGTKAQKAAGKIHTDIERGFIRAEIVSYDDLIACGSEQAAKEKGLVRLEGKDYVMQDGDVTYFRFNV